MRRTKATLIYRRTKNLRAVQLLPSRSMRAIIWMPTSALAQLETTLDGSDSLSVIDILRDLVNAQLFRLADLAHHIQIKIGSQIRGERFTRLPDVVTTDFSPIGIEEKGL